MFRQFDGEFGFSPDGRLLQNEYAGRAASQGPLIIGVTGKSCVVLLAKKQNSNPLIVTNDSNSIAQVSEKIFAGFSGMSGDSNFFLNKLRTIAASHRNSYGTEPTVQSLANSGLDSLHPNNQKYDHPLGFGGGPTRPLGSSFLLAGIDGNTPKLVKGATSSSSVGCLAGAIGTGAEAAEAYLSDHFEKDLDDEKAQNLAIDTLKNVDHGAEYSIRVIH
ncbi:Proteasome subunit alpha type-5-A [Tritrichomonas foetus]|uniref:Proteasome subunit alpha type-5-A n=1 Tax=Tritrichomonas foetus TaxID=1144522 RepID=A0A1J4KC62_9EUKA|nr:Proteasome subunit alpha type-5-A [Tritrichomonas foetus]|eukprot:OHT09009.1 Proteasome subunit alpha type-5-A [Tritrichomonas foetus]